MSNQTFADMLDDDLIAEINQVSEDVLAFVHGDGVNGLLKTKTVGDAYVWLIIHYDAHLKWKGVEDKTIYAGIDKAVSRLRLEAD